MTRLFWLLVLALLVGVVIYAVANVHGAAIERIDWA